MGANKKKAIKAYCPKCEKYHITAMGSRLHQGFWSGDTDPILMCYSCKQIIEAHRANERYRNFRTKKRTILLSLCKTRGITREQKKKHDLNVELEGRKLRKKLGIEAPAHIYYIPG